MSAEDVLEGKVAIVTGGGKGVGRGIALALGAAGAVVVVAGRTFADCETVVGELRAEGVEARAVRCDTERRAEVAKTVADTVGAYGRLDILVNSAQSMTYKSIRKLTEEDLTRMWESGPMGTFRFQQEAFEHLRSSQGVVLNLGSGSSILPAPQMGGYVMAKEAIRMLTRVTAVEWGRFGIRVNALCPVADSPGFDTFKASAPGAFETHVLPQIPLGRLGDARADIGPAAVFLCSNAAAYITGTTLMVDGGFNFLR